MLLSEEELTLKKALEITNGMEMASEKVSEFHTSESKVVPDDILTISGAKIPCYRCAKTGHLPDSCYFHQQKCWSCGKMGHIVKACQSTNKKQSTVNKSNNKRANKKKRDSIPADRTSQQK